jgi:hypothetical protein
MDFQHITDKTLFVEEISMDELISNVKEMIKFSKTKQETFSSEQISLVLLFIDSVLKKTCQQDIMMQSKAMAHIFNFLWLLKPLEIIQGTYTCPPELNQIHFDKASHALKSMETQLKTLHGATEFEFLSSEFASKTKEDYIVKIRRHNLLQKITEFISTRNLQSKIRSDSVEENVTTLISKSFHLAVHAATATEMTITKQSYCYQIIPMVFHSNEARCPSAYLRKMKRHRLYTVEWLEQQTNPSNFIDTNALKSAGEHFIQEVMKLKSQTTMEPEMANYIFKFSVAFLNIYDRYIREESDVKLIENSLVKLGNKIINILLNIKPYEILCLIQNNEMGQYILQLKYISNKLSQYYQENQYQFLPLIHRYQLLYLTTFSDMILEWNNLLKLQYPQDQTIFTVGQKEVYPIEPSFAEKLNIPAKYFGLWLEKVRNISVPTMEEILEDEDSAECGICRGEYDEDSNIALLSNCLHKFCFSCISTWFSTAPQ